MKEKAPKDYSQRAIQRLLETITRGFQTSDRARAKDLQDMSKDLSSQIQSVEKKASKALQQSSPQGIRGQSHLPIPENLTVYKLGGIGFAMVDAFKQKDYRHVDFRGYEFYGSCNSGFNPTSENYSQTGTHSGDGPADAFIKTDTFVLEGALTGKTIQNTTDGTEGTIGIRWPASPYYRRAVSGVTFDTGDGFRIKNYPDNKLFSLGSLAFFTKPPLIDFHVIARTFGKGHTYSSFTDEVSSSNVGHTLNTPTIVLPKCVACGGNGTEEDPYTEMELDHEDWIGKPWCPTHGALDWYDANNDSTAMLGTMEINHRKAFGVEKCDFVFIYQYEGEKGVRFECALGSTDKDPDE